MAELKKLAFGTNEMSIDASDFIKYDENGISIPFKYATPSQSVTVPTGTNVDTIVWTAPETCLAWIAYKCQFSANATGVRSSVMTREGGAAITTAFNRSGAAPSGVTVHTGSYTFRIDEGVPVRLQAWQSSGASLTAQLDFDIRYIPVVGDNTTP